MGKCHERLKQLSLAWKCGHNLSFLERQRWVCGGPWEGSAHTLSLDSCLCSVGFRPSLGVKQQKYLCSVWSRTLQWPFPGIRSSCVSSIVLLTFKTPRLRPCEEPAHSLSLTTLSVRPCKAVLMPDSYWHSLLVLYFCSLYIVLKDWLSLVTFVANLNTSPPTGGTLPRQTLWVLPHCSGDSGCT